MVNDVSRSLSNDADLVEFILGTLVFIYLHLQISNKTYLDDLLMKSFSKKEGNTQKGGKINLLSPTHEFHLNIELDGLISHLLPLA